MGQVGRGHAEGDIEWRNRGCFGCVSLLFSPRAEVLLSIAKGNNSIFHLTGNNANLSHTSRFLCLPHGVTSFLHRVLCWLFVRVGAAAKHTFNLYPFQHCRSSWLRCVYLSPAAPRLNRSESHLLCARRFARVCICACYAHYLYVCERDRGMMSTKACTLTCLSHPLCPLLSLSISCGYRADFITLLAAGRLPVTNWDG